MNIGAAWQSAWRNNRFRIQLIFTLAILLSIGMSVPQFFSSIQNRNGKVLTDPFLNLIGAHHLSFFIFTLIYLALATAIISLLFYPEKLLIALEAYCLLTLVRLFFIWLIPLNPPAGIIVLHDPFTDSLWYGDQVITKDLFFSGHTSAMFLLFLTTPIQRLKIFFLVVTALVAIALLMQHVHYSIDVLAAPVFSFACYLGIRRNNFLHL